MDSYTASTVPGCRTPDFWRDDGGSIYDAMGPEFTLLRFDSSINTAPLEAAALRRALPLTVLDVGAPACDRRGRGLLVRPHRAPSTARLCDRFHQGYQLALYGLILDLAIGPQKPEA